MTGLEALKEFKGNNNAILVGRVMGKQHYLDCLQTIEKSLKALEIIKEKYVHIPQLLCAFENQLEEENPLEVYYNGQVGINVPMPLTEEEFNLLKEVLEWAD